MVVSCEKSLLTFNYIWFSAGQKWTPNLPPPPPVETFVLTTTGHMRLQTMKMSVFMFLFPAITRATLWVMYDNQSSDPCWSPVYWLLIAQSRAVDNNPQSLLWTATLVMLSSVWLILFKMFLNRCIWSLDELIYPEMSSWHVWTRREAVAAALNQINVRIISLWCVVVNEDEKLRAHFYLLGFIQFY